MTSFFFKHTTICLQFIFDILQNKSVYVIIQNTVQSKLVVVSNEAVRRSVLIAKNNWLWDQTWWYLMVCIQFLEANIKTCKLLVWVLKEGLLKLWLTTPSHKYAQLAKAPRQSLEPTLLLFWPFVCTTCYSYPRRLHSLLYKNAHWQLCLVNCKQP